MSALKAVAHERDALAVELDAIARIGRALSDIPNPETRARVLRWACERFNVQMPSAAPTAAPAGPVAVTLAEDPTLAVESLQDMFEAPAVETAAAQSAQPASTLLRGFVSDFQQLVVEWQGA